MRRWNLPLATALLLTAAACGPAQVVVTAEVSMANADGEGMTTNPIPDMEVQLLPYDRDAIFDSLTSAYSTPEPSIPQELLDAREEVAQAQQRWQQSTNRWNTLRDTLTKLNDAMQQYSRGEARYVALFREWQELDSQYGRVERQMNSAFEEFNQLQQSTLRASDSIRILKENWGDEAFADFNSVRDAKMQAVGLQPAVDTTDANGIARNNLKVKPGDYWVYARYELPYTELYWNVPVHVERGEPNQITLTRNNAQERVKL